ncbi:MAG: hypothetical protein PQJ61_14020 [Spirochaetales bacterium]|uniref:MotA/TolQ/ExbB proton channel domain-containing protein n=1 Tax=Candidatus Thalassospirochaeta sargassi TaxID=3119039 RepID=A0AAJ1IEJ7_9SPIO|nr:hypothetical protein [Spirochaetales bacterium]
MKKTYILSVILFTIVCIFGMIMSGCITCFFDIGSLAMVLLSTFIMMLANYSTAEIKNAFTLGFSRDLPEPPALKAGIIFFKAFQKYLILSGAMGFFLGLIAMLALLDAPEIIGRGMALALLSVLYAVFFSAVIAVPFRTGLEKKLAEAENK